MKGGVVLDWKMGQGKKGAKKKALATFKGSLLHARRSIEKQSAVAGTGGGGGEVSANKRTEHHLFWKSSRKRKVDVRDGRSSFRGKGRGWLGKGCTVRSRG